MPSPPQNPARVTDPLELTDEEIAAIAEDGYLYGYPLVLMDLTCAVMTAVSRPGAYHAPKNQFNVSTEFPDATFTDVVSPNVDTLYSSAWLDLSEEPIILSLPDTGERYYLMEMLDAWTNVFASPGTRTTGNRAGQFAIVGPGWEGSLPVGAKAIQSPTSLVWIIGRTKTDGPSDYAAVRSLKAKYTLTPLSQWERGYTPPASVPIDPSVDAKTAPAEQVTDLSADQVLRALGAAAPAQPAGCGRCADDLEPRADRCELRARASISDSASRRFAQAIERGVAHARTALIGQAHEPHGKIVNGWDVMTDLGRYGTDYGFRAVVAMLGLGANLPEDAVYPHAMTDAQGEPLSGTHRYRIHFDKGELPPVDAFWSLTLYDSRQYLVENPIHRYALGDRDDLRFEPDGSLNIYVQHDPPGRGAREQLAACARGRLQPVPAALSAETAGARRIVAAASGATTSLTTRPRLADVKAPCDGARSSRSCSC